MNDQVSPFNLLKEEMENDEISIRVNAIHRLKIVATLMSPDDVKNQLLPFLEGKKMKKTFNLSNINVFLLYSLTGLIKKEDDEVLFAIAEELGSLA